MCVEASDAASGPASPAALIAVIDTVVRKPYASMLEPLDAM
jgi:hypothetical protein